MSEEKKSGAVNVRSAHLSEIGGTRGFSIGEKENRALMEGYWGRIPEDQRVTSLRLAWQDLWSKASLYMPKDDMKAVGETFVFSSEAHGSQRRYTGEPYIIHTVSVASILAGMEMDRETIIAALLHDVLEDTSFTGEQLKERFGEDVVTLVDGVTKLGKLQFKSVEEYQAENLRKMFVVMAKDIRVVLIKLADRLHNMRTISSHRREKQLSIARETLEIYAPLAHRLGIYQVKRELEDLSFRILDPEMYYDIKRRVRKKLPEREMIIKEAMDILSNKLKEEGIEASIKGRPKHFYSIYEKMRRKNLSLEQLYDLLALRVIVKTVGECYQVLGLVHTIWKPIPGLFDDYIANPKSNMYQSLHTTVVGPNGDPLEVQIRTKEMHFLAEYGIAAHWNYKEGGQKVDNLDKGLTWIRKALETSAEGRDSDEAPAGAQFMDNLKTDVLSSDVFVFTPKGKVVSVPNGSTSIDFAYAIHTEIGHKCVGTMINGRIAPMDQELQNGDIVRILTSPQGKPSRDWLKIAKSSRTRAKIKSWFRQQERQEREEKSRRGRELLEKEASRRNPGVENPLEPISPQLAHIAREQKRRAANGQDGHAELIDRLRAAARSIVGNVARVANHHDAAGILFPHHINGNRVGHDFAIHALAAHLAGNGLALGTAEIQDQDHIVAHGSFLTLLALRRALADDIKLAQNLFGNVHAQHGHDLQPIDHHIGKFLGDQRYALGIFPAHQRPNVFFFEPLKMLQHFRHFHGHGHGHVLGVLDAVVAPALITA